MKALKTIVATAVIVFALTSVAMAGVQHFTKQGSQATGTRARSTQPTYTVSLTAAQLAKLMNGGKAAAAGGAPQQVRQAKHHAKAAHQRSGSGGTHHSEPVHHVSHATSTSGGHHPETSHHSGDCGDDGGAWGD